MGKSPAIPQLQCTPPSNQPHRHLPPARERLVKPGDEPGRFDIESVDEQSCCMVRGDPAVLSAQDSAAASLCSSILSSALIAGLHVPLQLADLSQPEACPLQFKVSYLFCLKLLKVTAWRATKRKRQSVSLSGLLRHCHGMQGAWSTCMSFTGTNPGQSSRHSLDLNHWRWLREPPTWKVCCL